MISFPSATGPGGNKLGGLLLSILFGQFVSHTQAVHSAKHTVCLMLIQLLWPLGNATACNANCASDRSTRPKNLDCF